MAYDIKADILTEAQLIRELGDIAGRFDINAEQAELIASKAIREDDPVAAFVRIWENEGWWL